MEVSDDLLGPAPLSAGRTAAEFGARQKTEE
jgi:hypothetical protein